MFDENAQTNGDQEQQTQPTQEQQPTVQEDWLVVGERKFDKDAAAKKIEHADTHISKLEQELAELRSKLEQDQARQEAQKAMFPEKQEQEAVTPQVQNTTETKAEVDEALLLSKVTQILTQRETESNKQKNIQDAVQAAQSVYGESYQSKLEALGSELGMSKDDIKDLAATKPQAFKRLFGLNQQPKQQPAFNSSVVSQRIDTSDDPLKSTAKLVLSSTSSKDRTAAIAALLSQTTKR